MGDVCAVRVRAVRWARACEPCGGFGCGGRVGQRGGCGAALCAPNIKQGCRRQPCSLSIFESLKPMQFGFFGFLGSFFPKKLPKSGCGVKPRIYTFLLMSGCGARSPAIPFPLRGAAYFTISGEPSHRLSPVTLFMRSTSEREAPQRFATSQTLSPLRG